MFPNKDQKQLLHERENYSRVEYVLFHLSTSGNLHKISNIDEFVKNWSNKHLKDLVMIEKEISEIDENMYKDLHFPFEYKFAFFLPFLAPILLKYPILLYGIIYSKISNW